jgi:hypothetical protein
MFDERNEPKRFDPEFPRPHITMPKKLEEIIISLAKQFQIDLNTNFAIALGCIASALRGKIQVQITKDWVEPTTLYICAIAETADGKSQVLKLLAAPIRESESAAQDEVKDLNRIQEHKYEIAKANLEQLKKSQSNPKKSKNLPASDADLIEAIEKLEQEKPKPIPLWILGGDVTPDRLTDLLQDHQSLAIIEAEGVLFSHLSGKRHNTGASWETVLAAKTGDPIKSHRIGRSDGYVANPRLNICVAVQPDVWRELHQDQAATQRGVTGRFLPIVAKSMVGRRDVNAAIDYPIPDELIEAWRLAINNLLKITEDRTLTMDQESLSYFQDWRKTWELELTDEENRRSGFGNRLPGNLITIAALFTLFDDPGATKLNFEALEGACGLDDYFLKHRKLADDLKLERLPQLRVLDKLIYWIKKDGDVGDAVSGVEKTKSDVIKFSTRDLQQAMKQQTWVKEGGCEELKKILDELEMCSWIDQGLEENQWIASKSRILKYHRS